MNNDHQDIEKILSKTSFRPLSNEEQSHVWMGIENKIENRSLLFTLTRKPMFTSILVALLLSIGVGGTVVTADNAGPGDKLFGVDQAVEKLRLRLSADEKKNELRIKFADERVKEIEKISGENNSLNRPGAADITATSVSSIEADVFTNETLIKIKYSNNKNFVFHSDAKTKTAVIDDINTAFPDLSKSFIESKLDFEVKERVSSAEDKGGKTLSDNEKAKITTGVAAALTLLNGVSASLEGDDAARLKVMTDRLNTYLADGDADVRINDNGNKTRVDLRTEDGKMRVEIKDTEVKIKTSADNDNEEDEDEEDNTLEIEANIFTNETVVKVEINDKKTTFTTSAKTRAEIIAAVHAKYPTLTTAQIESELEIEVEDRASRINDIIKINLGKGNHNS